MSTHPRDYPKVDSVVSELRQRNYKAVKCYGIHPWFLNEVLSDEEQTKTSDDDDEPTELWLKELRDRLVENPDAIVGEIGLDGARWVEVDDYGKDNQHSTQHNNNDNALVNTKEDTTIWRKRRTLACPMELQKRAFEQQLQLAAELKRPVSIHVVRAWGELFDSLDVVREQMKQKYISEEEDQCQQQTKTIEKQSAKRKKATKELLLPPKMYFHAFSGKAGVLPSLLAACAKGNLDPDSDVYFGFAPAISTFQAPKTPAIMKQIGLHRLLLETDIEDASCAWEDLIRGVEGVADALDLDVNDAAEGMFDNAERFYFGRAV